MKFPSFGYSYSQNQAKTVSIDLSSFPPASPWWCFLGGWALRPTRTSWASRCSSPWRTPSPAARSAPSWRPCGTAGCCPRCCWCRSEGNCIKLGLPGKSILRYYFQENRTSRRPFLTENQFSPEDLFLYNSSLLLLLRRVGRVVRVGEAVGRRGHRRRRWRRGRGDGREQRVVCKKRIIGSEPTKKYWVLLTFLNYTVQSPSERFFLQGYS